MNCLNAPITPFNCGPGTLCEGFYLTASYWICRDNNLKDHSRFIVDAILDLPTGVDLTNTTGYSLGWMAEDETGNSGFEFSYSPQQ